MKRLGLIAALAGALLILPLRQDVGALAATSTSTTNTAETYKELNLFGDVFEKVRSQYVDDVSDDSLIEGAINGMLTSLDPHSNYLNAKNFNDMKVQTRGEFGGLGIEVSMENGLIKVVSPIDDTPAARAGLKPGDLITQLDGSPVQGMTLPEAVEKMRGPVNSDITLRIRRTGKDPFDVKLTRATIKIQSVRSHLEDGNVGYVRVTSFNEQTDVGLENALKGLKQQAGSKLAGIVLDLRNNPGGLLDQAVAVSDDFLDKGEIVSTRGRKPDDAQRYNAHPGDITGGLPVVVLINSGSASASEIVAGALQDNRRATVLGTRSFGKGSVQSIIPIEDHGALRLTTALYYTPSGRSIQGQGITPDDVVPLPKEEQVANALVTYESDLYGSLKPTGALAPTNSGPTPRPRPQGTQSNDHPINPTIIGTPQDAQLQAAIEYLKKHPRSASAK
jgi:carboxyl-terminal processing protease